MTLRTTMVTTGRHQIEVNVFGHGSPAIVIEPSFGGSAREWQPIAEELAAVTTVVTYDRAPYGASSRARDRRTPVDISRDLHAVLEAAGVTGPLVLVGFSVGGLYVRRYAAMYPSDVSGMVLIESSHEGQTPILNRVFTWKVRLEGLLFYPQTIFSRRAYREGADRWSLIREWRSFRGLTAADKPLGPGDLGNKPLVVVTRADGGPYGGRQWELWHAFHAEQARLSGNSRHVVSALHEHELYKNDPTLVITVIEQVVDSARTGDLLTNAASQREDVP